ncbi:MAG: hypothetical protein ACRELC_02865, partial [Gemmatimonadota bacterium]
MNARGSMETPRSRHAARIGGFLLVLAGIGAAIAACEGGAGAPPTPEAALGAIDAAGLGEATRTLSSDEFQGRAPASEGERRTIAYLRERFTALELEPANGDSWLQEVPLVSITTDAGATLR